MSDFLQQMVQASAKRVTHARAVTRDAEMRRAAEYMPPARSLRFGVGIEVIAEVKRAAPSGGVLSGEVDVGQRVRQYEQAGAAAISVLTEPERFHGTLTDLREASAATTCPVMRKDFLVDPYQVFEARANGGDGVLLIAAILDDAKLADMLAVAEHLGMFALVEAFSELDIERAQLAGAEFVGVNCRNLRDLSIEFDRFQRLRALIDPDRYAVAESGITSPEQFARVHELGYHAALIGSALMRENDPATTLRNLTASTELSQ